MSKNEIDISGLPKELRDKIIDILGTETIPAKKVTLQEILPELDLPRDKRDEILKILNPKNIERVRQEEINRNRLEALMKKNRSRPDVSKSIETIRQELNEKRKRRS